MSAERPIDRVLSRLEKVSSKDGYYMALCPHHDDREPSLSIKEGEDSRVLLKCFAGCSFDEVVAAIDLKTADLFLRGGRGLNFPRNGATPQHSPKEPHGNAENTVADPDTTPDNTATPPAEEDGPHLRVVGGTSALDCTLDAYAEYVGIPTEFLRGLGLKEIHYIDQKAVKIPYLDEEGNEEVCVRFRVSLTGKPKIKTRKGDKHHLYGLWKLDEAREAGYVIAVEGESDSQTGWRHDEPVIGVPGASAFQSEWVEQLNGIDKIYAIVEPGQGGETFWQCLAATSLRERLYRVELDGAKDLGGAEASPHRAKRPYRTDRYDDPGKAAPRERNPHDFAECHRYPGTDPRRACRAGRGGDFIARSQAVGRAARVDWARRQARHDPLLEGARGVDTPGRREVT